MATTQPRQLARLQIPPTLGQQQPFVLSENAPIYSPSLPTAIQAGMHGSFPFLHPQQSLQTPVQPSFFPRQPPGAPARPTAMHRAHPSVAFAAAGMLPPPGMPMTPLGQVAFPPPLFPAPFVPRSKRTQSVSTGGPPKAVLGGPQRKVSPMPVIMATVQPAPKTKKVAVNLPKETVRDEEGNTSHQSWARTPLPQSDIPKQPEIAPPELLTCEPYPPDAWRHHIPPTVDVFLPGKATWDAMKKKLIEEKLEKLGVERGFSAPPSHIHAPHARAASISSPADPALLYFKLNKLQQSQNASNNASLVPSPQPSSNLSSSPSSAVPPRFQNRHGHSMSLAPAGFYNPTASFNPFGPNATLGSDQIFSKMSLEPTATTADGTIHAPQGRVPTSISSLAPPSATSRPESRPDFARGFGLDIPEEEEPPEDAQTENDTVDLADSDQEDDGDVELDEEGVSTVAQSRIHSRHVSKLSAPLSLRSVGGTDDSAPFGGPSVTHVVPAREPVGDVAIDDLDKDAVAEWTGSEDLGATDDESIGEWSNPSDEERARQERVHRRMLRHSKQTQRDLEAPRRLPRFPRPPETGSFVHLDDDVISNPSEEGDRFVREQLAGFDQFSQQSRPGSNYSGRGRPLPAIPHSRTSSAHFSYHDPALAHSREASDHFNNGAGPILQSSSTSAFTPSATRTESLNPLAKPFVFGHTFVPAASASAPALTTVQTPSHTRAPSIGKPLNVAAPEFKPSGFTFQPPPGVPQLNFTDPVTQSRPLPIPPVPKSPVRATQGREKRQRRSSTLSLEEFSDHEGDDTMSSFKFPPQADERPNIRHSAPASPPSSGTMHPDSKPRTFSGFPNHFDPEAENINNDSLANQDVSGAETTIQAESAEPESALELPYPPTSKPKRTPIPLDFKHPVSHNTVPAGLFKALVNNDNEERTRRVVRSRLSSRDVFELDHSPRPSLDDLAMPTISQRKMRDRLFTEPLSRSPRATATDAEETYSPPRRSSLPPRHVLRTSRGSVSDGDLDVPEWERRIDLQEYEDRMEALLEEKLEETKRSLLRSLENLKPAPIERRLSPSPGPAPGMAVAEIMSLLRTQLKNAANKETTEGATDAHGEFDFEALKNIIEQTQAESRSALQHDLEAFMESHDTSKDFRKFAEELSERTIKSVISATSQLTMHLHTVEKSRGSFAAEREAIAQDVQQLLAPSLAAICPEPIDYEGLTAKLSQAVKPQITQLIDLAADKRETAGLIVDRLVPILPSLYPPPPNVDMDTLLARLSAEMRGIIGPLDAHEIKEQVSDLVVERLDSRLAVRDRALSADTIAEKVKDLVSDLLEPVAALKNAVDGIVRRPDVPSTPSSQVPSLPERTVAALFDLPSRLASVAEVLDDTRAALKATQERVGEEPAISKDIEQVQDVLDQIADDQKKLISQNTEFSDFCQDIIKHINALPEAMVEATKVLQGAHADIISRDTSQKDAEEIRRLMVINAELNVQLAKARGAHGQVRVEKDALGERYHVMENDRDQMRTQLEEFEAALSEKAASLSAAETKKAELEVALEKALESLESSDVAVEHSRERISALEKTAAELTSENGLLKTKVERLEISATYTAREKDSLVEEVALLRSQNEEFASQQSHWEELRSTSEQLQALLAHVRRSNGEESQELQRARDSINALEAENATLQRRFKDQESKAANSDKAAQIARQSLAQAQQRAAEWERRANEYQSDLKSTRDLLEQQEQAHKQLEEEQALTKMQLEERDAEERLAKDRESKLRDQIAALEAQMSRVQVQADMAKKSAPAYSTGPFARMRQNGYTPVVSHTPVRPDSRSTVFIDSRVPTPTAPLNGAKVASPEESVWDSIHAPIRAPSARRDEPIRLPMTPRAARPQAYYRPQMPSPTPSNVSAAPTLGDDGWWSYKAT